MIAIPKKPRRKKTSESAGYEAFRKSEAARRNVESAAGREIGPIPPVADPLRKALAGRAVQTFIETYLRPLFSVRGEHWPWSRTHIEAMQRIDQSVRDRKRFAIAMERGGGKTSLLKAGTLYATLYGFQKWVCLLGATAPKASSIIADLQIILETNELLHADFPEVCYPILKLERIVNRQRGQTFQSRPTRMTWNSDEIIFPDIPGSRCAGGIITSSGLDGAGIRGQVKAMPDGTQCRPTLVFLDDIQTDEVAKSEFQVAERLDLLGGAVLEMGPPGVPLAALMAVTVIRENDVADTVLKDPQWNAIRSPMLRSFPIHQAESPPDVPHGDWWDQYATLLSANQIGQASKLYAAHRPGVLGLPECEQKLDEPRPCLTCPVRDECMDAGAVVSWIHRKYPADLSAVQHAMDRHIRNPELFAAEMQQSPRSKRMSGAQITPEQVQHRVNGMARGQIQPAATCITAHVDVHDEILYWMVCSFEEDFTGQIIQYGTFPEQPGKWFKHANPPRPMSRLFPGASKDAVIVAGLEKLCGIMMSHEFTRSLNTSSTAETIDSMLIDIGYHPDEVYIALRKLQNKAIRPARGLPLSATSKPIEAYEKRPGWRIGHHWYIKPQVNRDRPHVGVDTNYWKSDVQSAFSALAGTRGGMTIYGTAATMSDHEMVAQHIARGEFFVEDFANGRSVRVYREMPGRPGNHHFDNLVGCRVAASILGCKAPAAFAQSKEEPARKGPRRLMSISDLKR